VMEVVVRTLTADDVDAYRSVRRRALVEHPEAFTSTPESLDRHTPEEVAASLQPTELRRPFGAFVHGELVGMAAFARNDNPKTAHWAGLYQMYVAPEQRGQGLGMELVQALVDHTRQQPGLEQLRLTVTVGNAAAEQLYARAGFAPGCVEERVLKVNGRYYDFLQMVLWLEPGSARQGEQR